MFPDDALVLVSDEIAGTHLQTSLTYLYDTDAILVPAVQQDPLVLQRLVVDWLEEGRDVFFVTREQGFSAPRLVLSDHHRVDLEIPTLETTLRTIPRQVEVRRVSLNVFRVMVSEAPKVAVDVGTPSDDLLFALQGFFPAERHRNPTIGTFRWSGELATITVPAEEEIRLVIAGGRPEGVAAAEINVWIDGQLVLAQELVPPWRTTMTIRLANPTAQAGALSTVTVGSTTFNPRSLGLSDDARDLGIRLLRAEYSSPAGPGG